MGETLSSHTYLKVQLHRWHGKIKHFITQVTLWNMTLVSQVTIQSANIACPLLNRISEHITWFLLDNLYLRDPKILQSYLGGTLLGQCTRMHRRTQNAACTSICSCLAYRD